MANVLQGWQTIEDHDHDRDRGTIKTIAKQSKVAGLNEFVEISF
jgi:hypothetical protein